MVELAAADLTECNLIIRELPPVIENCVLEMQFRTIVQTR